MIPWEQQKAVRMVLEPAVQFLKGHWQVSGLMAVVQQSVLPK